MDEDKNSFKAIPKNIFIKPKGFPQIEFTDAYNKETEVTSSIFIGVNEIFGCVIDAMGNVIDTFREFVKQYIGDISKAQAGIKAYERSQRNNQYVKRYKHGRTQRTRVKRK